MATCPYCKGHLTDGHRCPRRRIYVVAEIVAAAIAGGLGGWILLLAFDPRGVVTADGLAIGAGMLVGIGINRFARS
jgi:hypothetical protein